MASISSLLAKKRQKQQELKRYKSRKSGLEKIRNNVNNDFDDIIMDAIELNNNIERTLAASLSGDNLKVVSVCDEIEGLRETSVHNDKNMENVLNSIRSEISRCEDEIERLEYEIRRIERQIREAMSADKE